MAIAYSDLHRDGRLACMPDWTLEDILATFSFSMALPAWARAVRPHLLNSAEVFCAAAAVRSLAACKGVLSCRACVHGALSRSDAMLQKVCKICQM